MLFIAILLHTSFCSSLCVAPPNGRDALLASQIASRAQASVESHRQLAQDAQEEVADRENQLANCTNMMEELRARVAEVVLLLRCCRPCL